MEQTISNIDDFVKGEEQKMTWLDRLMMNYPKVRPTNSISRPLQDYALPERTVIKPSISDQIMAVIICLFLAIPWIGLLRLVLAYKLPFAIILFGFLLATFLAFLLIRNSFFNKKYIYTLTFDKEGVSVDSHKILWADISGVYIMNRQEGKRTNYYLLFFKTDKTIKKLDLFRMGSNDRKIATIVEYYKQKSNT